MLLYRNLSFTVVSLLTYLLAKKELTLQEIIQNAGSLLAAGIDTVSISS